MHDEKTLYFTLTDLRGRGWSDTTIREHLGEADVTKQNPHYRNAPPMRLYLLHRVEQSEACPEWVEGCRRTERRRASAVKAAATKRANLLAQLGVLEVYDPGLSIDSLTERACAHYNERRQRSYPCLGNPRDCDYNGATSQSKPEFLARITVNYLRHCLTPYEVELARIAGRVGVAAAYAEINRRVYAAIAGTCPELAEECQRQLSMKLQAPCDYSN